MGLTVLAGSDRIDPAYRRLGFREEDVLRDHRHIDVRYVDELVLSMLRDAFEQPE